MKQKRHAAKPDDERRDARAGDPLAQPKRGDERDEDRRGVVEQDRIGERQISKGMEVGHHRSKPRGGAHEVQPEARRAQAYAPLRKHRRKEQKRRRIAEEHDLGLRKPMRRAHAGGHRRKACG
ncbi:MAG: hypothetical protein D6771_04810 [Zetaproteobacteria bacterium]|nr:MAG: hypothetical protein D6771_04810 [Zetaproteobacteria bacterium]